VIAWTYALLTPIPPRGEGWPSPQYVHLFGKTLHVGVYAFFTVLSAWLSVPFRFRWLLIVFISFHGLATEYLQQFVERGSLWSDVGLDHLGLALGLAVSWKWWRA